MIFPRPISSFHKNMQAFVQHLMKLLFNTNSFLKGYSRTLFLYFRLFNTVESKMFYINFCRWRDSNHGPLVWKRPLYQLSHNQSPLILSLLLSYNITKICVCNPSYLKKSRKQWKAIWKHWQQFWSLTWFRIKIWTGYRRPKCFSNFASFFDGSAWRFSKFGSLSSPSPSSQFCSRSRWHWYEMNIKKK